ncbi:hypothetical protein CVT25_005069 [Psilocybe cyanescens]|uniref:Uncharacterized protein n=1 Tax=Psilocybe cyanescens TaxID=93625 RepID=A0A409XDY9_PSICY|nr:hypothetical protein CVT25_005069 [Psilocybe cyanescens]
MSLGDFLTSGWDKTSEGIGVKLTMQYFSRRKLIKDLRPALIYAKEGGEGAGKIDANDLGLKTYSVTNTPALGTTYDDFMIEEINP